MYTIQLPLLLYFHFSSNEISKLHQSIYDCIDRSQSFKSDFYFHPSNPHTLWWHWLMRHQWNYSIDRAGCGGLHIAIIIFKVRFCVESYRLYFINIIEFSPARCSIPVIESTGFINMLPFACHLSCSFLHQPYSSCCCWESGMRQLCTRCSWHFALLVTLIHRE